MEVLNHIKSALHQTKSKTGLHVHYPDKPGIYAIFLTDGASLKEFGNDGQLLYIGISTRSLNERDFKEHFATGKTGKSTLRRSIGAILYVELNLEAQPRGGINDSKRIEKYTFEKEGDERLTLWMNTNLEIGYWEGFQNIDKKQLKDLEKQLTIQMKPTLDLDNSTRKFNPLAEKLTCYRNKCKCHACEYLLSNKSSILNPPS